MKRRGDGAARGVPVQAPAWSFASRPELRGSLRAARRWPATRSRRSRARLAAHAETALCRVTSLGEKHPWVSKMHFCCSTLLLPTWSILPGDGQRCRCRCLCGVKAGVSQSATCPSCRDANPGHLSWSLWLAQGITQGVTRGCRRGSAGGSPGPGPSGFGSNRDIADTGSQDRAMRQSLPAATHAQHGREGRYSHPSCGSPLPARLWLSTAVRCRHVSGPEPSRLPGTCGPPCRPNPAPSWPGAPCCLRVVLQLLAAGTAPGPLRCLSWESLPCRSGVQLPASPQSLLCAGAAAGGEAVSNLKLCVLFYFYFA